MRITDAIQILGTLEMKMKCCYLVIVWMGFNLCLTTGCSNYLYNHSPSPFITGEPPDYSHEPYHGTGVVAHVSGNGKIVHVDFGENATPRHTGMTLLVIRDGLLVGKLASGGAGGSKPLGGFGCDLIEGTAVVGDKVFGIQHLREHKKAH